MNIPGLWAFVRRAGGAAALSLLLVCALAPVCSAYSVLTHEEIIDLLWDDQIKPLLLQKYPGTSEDDLRVAHGYAYGGCLIQDLGYYPFGTRAFSDLVHYVRSGDFVIALLADASDVNEYAFALGALSHYAADITGHPFVNAAVAEGFPKLGAKYGNSVTYEQNPSAHIRTEFGFDVVQVAKRRYSSDAYHAFIGFQVPKPLLERAFQETYGVELKDVFFNVDLSIGSFRRSVSSLIPEMTRVALLLKTDAVVQEKTTTSSKKFLYNLKRSDYEREWGKTYQKPGFGARVLAFLLRLMPKIGPFRTLGFQMPSSNTETLYLKSVDATVDKYRVYLKDVASNKLTLTNTDFDTGKPTKEGEYELTDAAYAKLLGKLADKKFVAMQEPLRQNILDFYKDPKAAKSTKVKPQEWNKTLENIQLLKAVTPTP